MFSGHGIYRDGVVFALAIRDGLFLKSDATSAPLYDAAGAKPFTYATKRGETTVASYRRMPEACFDDEEALRHWAGSRLPRPCGRRPRSPQGAGQEEAHATLSSASGSVSQTTRFRPLRLAA